MLEVHAPAGLTIRAATEADLGAVVGLIHQDELASAYESPGPPLPATYVQAFRALRDNPDNQVMVAELCGQVVGTFQIILIQQLSHQGGRVVQIESVYVAAEQRRRGIGAAMMRWAIARARERGCFRVQLTSNKQRTAAHRFYQRLGFVASHEGMKLRL